MSFIDKVLIVEDHEEAAAVLQQVVKTVFDSSAILCVASLGEGLKAIKEKQFDLALIDLGLPDGNGIDLIKALSNSPKTFVVVTTIFDDDEHLFESLKAGAQGYLLKGHQQDEIADFLQGILNGRPPLSPSIAQAILGHFHIVTSPNENEEEPSSLTDRESEVLQLIAKGCHVKEVAGMLEIANSTVSAHIKKIYQKLNIHNRAEATAAAVNLNLYNP